MSRFNTCLAETLRWEGRWSDHPRDRGGPTMRGIIITVYAGHRGIYVPAGGWKALRQHMGGEAYEALKHDLRNISDADVEAIYRRDYWSMMRGDDLPAGVDLAVFDFGVNSGVSRSIRLLQNLLGIKVDGHIGPATVSAVHAANPHDLVGAIMAERRKFLRGLADFDAFGKGWLSRCDGIEPVALAALGAGGPAISTASSADPLVDEDAQSATQGRADEAPRTVANSGTVHAAAAAGGLTGMQALAEVNRAAAETRGSGMLDLLAGLISSPAFLGSAIVLACTIYIFRERLLRIWREGA